MNTTAKPLIASVAGHVLLVGALIWLVGRAPPLELPQPLPPNAIEVAFAAPQPAPPPIPDPPALVEPEPSPPPVPDSPVVEQPPPVPVAQAEPPPPPPLPKPVVRRPSVERRVVAPPPRPPVERPPMERPAPAPRYTAPMQTAALPPMPSPAPPQPVAPPAPTISAGYRATLSAWLEGHKQYPNSAREHGEQGRVVLRFHVTRSGRVLDYAVTGSSGYPDLDAAVDAMMRGAVLPPFPADMAAPEIEVAVTVRFALTR